jgi:Zn-dependent protease with chaperone function
MFVKPFSIILVYILTVINFLILTIPFVLIFTPLIYIDQQGFVSLLIDFLSACAVLISFLMILYLAFDVIFGFSIWSLTKGDKPTTKYQKKYKFMSKIEADFQELRKQFGSQNIKLLISRSGEINAYAVGCMRAKYVVLTFGLLKHYQDNCNSEKEFHACIKAIMGHELSHVINKDYIPALLLILNDKAVNMVNNVIRVFFNIFITLTRTIPVVGNVIYSVLYFGYTFSNRVINFFYKYILYPIYNFVKLHLSRQIEYRCDRQAAEACTGLEMALALSLLGSSGYMTIFSSHPKTSDRVKYVKDIKHSDKKITSGLINQLSNLASFLVLVLILNFSYKNIDVNSYKYKYYKLKYRVESVKNTVYGLKNKLEKYIPF